MSIFLSLMRLKRARAALAIITGLMAGSLLGLRAAYCEIINQRPCDIFTAGNTPCVAAHSTVRSLYAKYTGALYEVKRTSDNATRNIGLLSDGYADAVTQDTFCANTTCVITRIYDQSPHHNDLAVSSGGHFRGPGPQRFRPRRRGRRVAGHGRRSPGLWCLDFAGNGLSQQLDIRRCGQGTTGRNVHGFFRYQSQFGVLFRLWQRRDERHRHRRRPHGYGQREQRFVLA